MNIFYLDPDPEVAARYHCDKHCVKMILESAQLLSTAHRVLDGDEFADEQGIYKAFSPNHPSAIWTRESCENYDYVWDLTGLAIYPHNLLMKSFTPPPQCMPDEYKVEGDPVQAYKNYYHGEKAYFAEWRLGAPLWWKGE